MKFKFSCQASRDIFTKDLKKEEYKILGADELEVITAMPMKDDKDAMSNMMYELSYKVANLEYANRYNQSEAAYYRQLFADHMDTAKHLPQCPSTEHMASAMKALGWDKTYEVQKRQIFASIEDGKGNLLKEVLREEKK